jgi:murein DD-endopeptidase MepM/ murein hydrolase activator NlpD
VDITNDLAAIQSRIAQITGDSIAPMVAPAPDASGPGTSFSAMLAGMLSPQMPPAAPAPPAVVPVSGEITSPFGERQNPLGKGTEFHPGVDIAADTGTPIRAAVGGQVVSAGPDGGYGNLVTVDDGNGITTRYGHCSQIFARVGQTVAPGDVIGAVGMTGRATGPHLHFEERQNDRPIDPLSYLQNARNLIQ